jgi:integrase
MGALYEKMKADLKLRRYSARTEKSYLYYAARFVRHFGRSPSEMGKAEIREFLSMLEARGESGSSLKLYVAAIRFLYAVTLERPAEVEHIPWPRVVQALPAVISRAEVEALLGKIEPLVCRMVVMTAYGTGLRISEVLSLETGDIDGKAGLIHVRRGKGGRPRLVMLPRRLLETAARVLATGPPARTVALPRPGSQQAPVPGHRQARGPLRLGRPRDRPQGDHARVPALLRYTLARVGRRSADDPGAAGAPVDPEHGEVPAGVDAAPGARGQPAGCAR